jgi:hypothetical protein
MRPVALSSAIDSAGMGKAKGQPGVVQARTRDATRAPSMIATSCAIMPPRLAPTTVARATRVAAAGHGDGQARVSARPEVADQPVEVR